MASRIRLILEMIRFSHTIFALPFALLAAVMAWSVKSVGGDVAAFHWSHLFGILVCMVGARSAGMAFNRLADRHIDAKNPRTENRHLPAGKLSVATVTGFIAISTLVFFGGTLLFLPNPIPVVLAVPVLLILFAYSYTKRFTSLAHFWLGLSLSLAPIATWLALRGSIVLEDPGDVVPAVILGLAVLCWVAGFDVIYACQDFEFDVAAKLKSVPARLGIKNALRLAGLCHLGMAILLALLPQSALFGGPQLELGWIYYLGLVPIFALLAYEHLVVSHDDLSQVNVAFFNINAIVSIGLMLLIAIDLWF